MGKCIVMERYGTIIQNIRFHLSIEKLWLVTKIFGSVYKVLLNLIVSVSFLFHCKK
jgi:hypothetical protein